MNQLSLFDQVLSVTKEKEVSKKVDEKELKKIYYTITEVAAMFSVNASLLRFWEKEFSKELGKVKKNKKGDRYYNKENIEYLNVIYYLLKTKKMTIEGAREMLRQDKKKVHSNAQMIENLEQVRAFLVNLKKYLA
ncbi:MAG: MerR family transcriptional regulator [Chitinophagaceae bacterium]|nr:MerR family transcriptional regulator [Chitinophagaceae bacterium]